VKDLLLTLKADILGPFDESGEVALGLDVLADTEVPGPLLDERVLLDVSLCAIKHNVNRHTYLDLLGSTSPTLGKRGRSGLLLSGHLE